jgi:hypothetical protein
VRALDRALLTDPLQAEPRRGLEGLANARPDKKAP